MSALVGSALVSSALVALVVVLVVLGFLVVLGSLAGAVASATTSGHFVSVSVYGKLVSVWNGLIFWSHSYIFIKENN